MTRSSVSAPNLRADAKRNLDRVLDAAARVFGEHGQDATLAEIAREAGVGIGTVYRRFADKDALLEALFADKLDDLVRLAEESAGSLDGTGATAHGSVDAGPALREFLFRLMEARATDRVLDVILLGADRGERFARELDQRFMPHVERLLDRAAEAGEVRAGMASSEVCLLAYMVGKVADITRGAGEDTWRRYAQILVDGTRPEAAEEALSPEPLSFIDIASALGGDNKATPVL